MAVVAAVKGCSNAEAPLQSAEPERDVIVDGDGAVVATVSDVTKSADMRSPRMSCRADFSKLAKGPIE